MIIFQKSIAELYSYYQGFAYNFSFQKEYIVYM